ncbi:MAG: twin-arginine translocase subunit TatC [candidate division KSB1 bacterium]|nr:twin-arginine translocase subunit TatC [candidate division KSB1 bacterium]MDZ7301337.1 twin-arginine translocase subunit TatC [candidate division KSB1 bacterium]MDZ7310778.1 twin-arginine translocase subunit TatC [candidate division KSB1 bacterium]
MNAQQSKNEKVARRDEREMPFLDHLEELRSRLIKSLLAVAFFTVVSWFFITPIFNFLVAPYKQAVELAQSQMQNTNQSDTGPAQPHAQSSTAMRLIYLNPTGGFMIFLKLAITVGMLLSIPVIVYQLWQFVAPGLLMHERRVARWVVLFTSLCFLIGAAFCYFVVLKYGLGFLLTFQSEVLTPMVSIDEYFGFVIILIAVFGLVFEMPVIAYFLTRIGLLTPEFLRRKRRYGIVTIFVAAAVLTPSVDAFTQILLAVPLLVLYEISIWVSRIALPKESKEVVAAPARGGQ